MKKILKFLTTICVSTTSTLSVVSCSSSDDIPSFSAVYTLGDSLSDGGALKSILSNLGLSNFADEIFYPEFNYKDESFSDGPPAFELLTQQLGFDNIAAFDFSFNDKELNQNGNNFAVGGTTATTKTLDSTSGETPILKNLTIDKQASELTLQHSKDQNYSNSLVNMEIGGNDLMNIARTILSSNKYDLSKQDGINKANEYADPLLDDAVNGVKSSLTILKSSGIKNIILMNAPDISKIPEFNSTSEDTKEQINWISKLSQYYNSELQKMFNSNFSTMKNYKMFNLDDEFTNLINIAKNKDYNFTDASIIDAVLTGEPTVWNKEANSNSKTHDNFLFWDAVHPNAWAHKQAEQDIWNQIIKKWNN